MQIKHFRDEVDSTGAKWKDLAPATIKARSGRVEKGILRKYKAAATKYGVTLSKDQIGTALSGELSQRSLFTSSRYPKLQDTGRMRNSITAFNTDKTAGAGTNVEYARIHQYGGWTGRGHNTYIPKREYLYINDAEKEVLAKMVIKEMIQNQLGGGLSSQ